jgi:hypothetical protein
VATNARADAVRAFAAEMSADEQRHIARLELPSSTRMRSRPSGATTRPSPRRDGLPLS